MRKIYLILGMWAALFSAKAQRIATFEDIELQVNSFYNGSDGAGGFSSGGIWFPNSYVSEYNYWSKFAVSNMKDTVASGYENQYSAVTAGGADSSGNFAVVYAPQEFNMTFTNPCEVNGFFITNSVYAYLSMLNGDDFSKKFGGADGSDPDYFRLVLSGKNAAGIPTDTLEFYLADFRSGDSKDDYIIKKWRWFDLSSLGVVSKLIFRMESSDAGAWGLNTPSYFCIDNFTVSEVVSNSKLNDLNAEVNVFPNPVKNQFYVEVPDEVQEMALTDGTGKIFWKEYFTESGRYPVSALSGKSPGMYFLLIKTKKGKHTQQIVKF